MSLYNYIYRRKSVRNYKDEPLSDNRLDKIKEVIGSFAPLYPDIPLSYRFETKAKGLLKSKAPHYLVISGQGKEGELENAGFIYQQLDLWFSSNNIGSIWLGGAKAAEKQSSDIIMIAFGKTDSVHRGELEFKRKPIESITNDITNECMKAVRLAPSGINMQPWYFEKTDDKIIVYEQVLKPPVSLVYKLTALDIGIALCHYSIACEHFGKQFNFNRIRNGESSKKNYRLFGEIASDYS